MTVESSLLSNLNLAFSVVFITSSHFQLVEPLANSTVIIATEYVQLYHDSIVKETTHMYTIYVLSYWITLSLCHVV